ncbi:MAG: glycosyltransferase family 1 protein [Acidobacteriota bacterium]|nr:glycosyltransferase family 1 protein [Acidobacteriota bacterium]
MGAGSKTVVLGRSATVPGIAVFTDTLDQVNGVSNTYQYLAAYCRRRKIDLDFFTYGSRTSLEKQGSVRIYRYRPRLPIRYYAGLVFDLWTPRGNLLKDCREGGYGLIHAATPGSMGLNALAAAKKLRLPLVGVYHTALPEYVETRRRSLMTRLGLPSDLLERSTLEVCWKFVEWFYRHCQTVLAPSSSIARTLERRIRVPMDRFSRGVDARKFSPEHRQEPARTTVLYVGRVSVEKNLPLLARIFRSRRDARLVVVGDGPFRSRMEREAPNAKFTGFVTGLDLSRAYASSDLFAFPSETDTFGNVVLEAMSSGLPVVVTDKMGPRELVDHGSNGFIASNDREFERYLDRLIKDKELRRSMGARSRTMALERTWDAVFGSLFDSYRKVIRECREPVA